ncbi:hypothetical protein VC83_04120 [Pseudogymnoascus destructans]|uniref:DNA repair metallo-beta-lactamase domain-containing protein n=2 Tax=Pseudogymnoascus destructans TaxID=655981 RepID=L8GD41_PSED2|nr:uncharacterized protein VC83_04120 [Pseudogymnoascus destructans]ELR10598.1 hypothetical protein GMDG_04870 [Pseudogymnoascus destructans 20631-21]OAF59280.1 hypothetical protein VC83_04120 [Pseudogymnoascus destructans]
MAGPSSSTKPLTPRPNTKTNVRKVSSQGANKELSAKAPGKANGSILNFFKKVEADDDGGLFLSGGRYEVSPTKKALAIRPPTPDDLGGAAYDDLYSAPDGTERYNESGHLTKRRRISDGHADTLPRSTGTGVPSGGKPLAIEGPEALLHGTAARAEILEACTPPPPDADNPQPRRIGAFLDDSDSEDGEALVGLDVRSQTIQDAAVKAEIALSTEGLLDMSRMAKPKAGDHSDLLVDVPDVPIDHSADGEPIPPLKPEETSYGDYGAFEDMDEYPDIEDEFAYGEEFMERKWMEEQEKVESADASEINGPFLSDSFRISDESSISKCPICDSDLGGNTTDEITRHVNACLDGLTPTKESTVSRIKVEYGSDRFSKASIARSGQANPFQLDIPDPSTSSAFSKLMSSKAEDAAWENAAAAEISAKGKLAYKRVCPFYKIMPGFYICVDAFRYGAVQGCNAYFLSHFHSDHYIGLTASWCHGPIYCSKVTGNLVKQQLRVDPKWVITLNFEDKVEVPNTHGVSVTMIPANHCPGSSLFLFEKVVRKGPNPKVQRILHCGDFRACPAHVEHPQLMPDIVDAITGKTRQQKIDVCYLDTTYLNPRYSFPSQDEVVQSCADVCVSMSKDKGDNAWERAGKDRTGASMGRFVDAEVKSKDSATKADPKKPRGRLLILCGTYSIGKENICLGIARALDCKIWAPPSKQKTCAALEDPELSSRMTTNPHEAQIHMQSLMEIRAETLQDYLNGLKPHFSRIVGFRPSGWNYRPPNSRLVDSPSVAAVLTGENWRSRYTMADLNPQRGSTHEAACFGVPYSEHSSFRELTMFCCALRIEKIVPTVNVGSAASRAKMKVWIDRWLKERRKKGVIRFGEGKDMVKW